MACLMLDWLDYRYVIEYILEVSMDGVCWCLRVDETRVELNLL